MYESFLRMKRRPFAAAPNVECYLPATAIEHARQTAARSIERAAGPALVIGGAGLGKSLVLELLAQQFSGRFDVVRLASGRLRSVRALLQNILFELKLPFRGLGEGELRLALLDRLEPSDRSPQGMLLLIDEAHALPASLLDEVRMITNLVRGGQPRVRLVLAGDLRLEERLANPRLASLVQRIASRTYLQPLTQEETFALVRHQLTYAGVIAQEVIDDAALEAIHQAAGGVPRLINQVCDHALILAAVAGERKLTATRIHEAWADLQQLPLPQRQPTEADDAPAIIEFGALGDSMDAAERAPARERRFDAPASHAAPSNCAPLGDFETLERGIDVLAGDAPDDFEPLAVFQPEVEIKFAAPHSPFGGVFDEEEVVIDRYATLEAQTLRNRPRVTSQEGREIAALLGGVQQLRQQLGVVRVDAGGEGTSSLHVAAEAFEDPFDPASDPVLPDYYPTVTENFTAAAANVIVEPPELVVVDTAGQTQASIPANPPGKAQRQEYRQLFARLRRGG